VPARAPARLGYRAQATAVPRASRRPESTFGFSAWRSHEGARGRAGAAQAKLRPSGSMPEGVALTRTPEGVWLPADARCMISPAWHPGPGARGPNSRSATGSRERWDSNPDFQPPGESDDIEVWRAPPWAKGSEPRPPSLLGSRGVGVCESPRSSLGLGSAAPLGSWQEGLRVNGAGPTHDVVHTSSRVIEFWAPMASQATPVHVLDMFARHGRSDCDDLPRHRHASVC
jgi:hypothetical protein